MGRKYKICLWGHDSPYVFAYIKEFSEDFDMVPIIYGRDFGYDFGTHITNPYKKRPLSTIYEIYNILRIMILFLRHDRKCDLHLVHFLTTPYATAIALMPIRKPMVYCVYGSDIRTPKGIKKRIVRRALRKMDLMFNLSKSFHQKYIVSKYGITEKKIVPILWFSLDLRFRRLNEKSVEDLRRKWNLNKEFVIFSPRSTTEFFNHHLLVEGTALLDEELKKKIQIVLTGWGDSEYRKNLVERGKLKKVEVIDLGKTLTPDEMAEIYNISIITANISKADDLGRSSFEAIMCGSIQLLNKNSGPYQDIFRDKKYCIFVDLKADEIAQGIESILSSADELRDEKERERIMEIINWDKNREKVVSTIRKLI